MKIELNKQLDKEVYLDFHELSVAGVNFGKKISDSHPTITMENYEKYIDDFYFGHTEELANVLGETIKCFDEVREVLFIEIPSIRDAIGAEELLFYPDLKNKLGEVKKVWERRLGAEEFILTSLRIIQGHIKVTA